ncbi:uncharacterized protein LOC144573867 isoform X3 [Carex rostrata]
MLEYERNPLQRNSSSSPVPTNQHSTNENNSVFDSNQNRPTFEFVREGSAQSSANIVPAKKPMFDLRLPASDYIENGNGLEGGFGLGNNTVSCFGKGGVFSSANGAGTSGSERNLVSDLNEPVEEITGLDFLGVNRDPVWHRRVDEGSSLGLFSGNRKIANEEWSLEKEKGGNSSGVNFFNPDRCHPNFTSRNSPGVNFFATYRSHQKPFKDQHAIAPQLFGQKLTFSSDPSQAQSTHIFSSNNSSNNNYNNHNSVAPTSFPVLDSSPHYNILNKNKGLMAGSIHPLNPFFNNGSGTAMRVTGDNSGYFLNAPRNLVLGNSGGQSFDLSKSNWEKNFAPGTSMDLNEPIPEGNREIKGIKLFGSNCGGFVPEADWKKNEINLNNTANEDELSRKASSSASVVAGEPNSCNMKLLGFPLFGSSSSNNKSALHANESSKSERRVDYEHVEPAKRVLIDLNEDLPLENDLNSLKERNEGKITRYVIDLEMPASQFDEADVGMQHEIEIERESRPDSSDTEAANTIVAISQLKINPTPSFHQPDALVWFADLAVSGCDKRGSEPDSDSEDLFESMTLKLEEVKSDDRFGTGNFCEKKFEGESSSVAGETGYTSLLFTRGRRGPARKRRQRRDFQRDVLPTIASLSRVEVTEDLQMIGGLMRACGHEFDSILTRRVGRGTSNAKGKRQQRSPQVNSPLRTPQVKQPDKHLPQTSLSKGNLPQANTLQNPCVNPSQRIPKGSNPQRNPPVMNQQSGVPMVNQPHGGPVMGPPQKVSLENQQQRALQPNRPQKITLVNHAHRFTLFNPRQKAAPINLSQNGGTEVAHSDMVLVANQMQRSEQNNQPRRSVYMGQSHTSAQAIPQQTVNQSSDMEGEGLSVIGWGRTTARRNRRPRGLPLAPQQQQPGNNNKHSCL